MGTKISRKKLWHNIDMLFGLAERLALLASQNPDAFMGRYTSIMEAVNKEERPMKKGMTQGDKILFLLRKGTHITKMDLMVHHKIATPTARITELRQAGHDIKSTWKRCPIDGSEYVQYSLDEQKAVAA